MIDRAGSPFAPVSVIVIARDEEDRIGPCLQSVSWASERIVIIDDRTTDGTARASESLATHVHILPWAGFAGTKRAAVSMASNPWILWIDADERIDAGLRAAIRSQPWNTGRSVAFRVRRRNRYLGRVMRHGNWGRDKVVRLFRRDRASFDDRLVHEAMNIDGPIGDLDGYLDHEPYRDLAHHWAKMALWTDLWAEQAMGAGRRARIADLLFRPAGRFFKGYLARGGVLDGREGFLLACMDGIYAWMKYAKLMERRRREGSLT
jgi:glycosyltransferase involved in cell wall biosynthesis